MSERQVNNIIIITSGRFPEGDAGAVRVLYVAKALTTQGFHVKVLCRGKTADKGFVDGIEYVSLRQKDGNKVDKVCEYLKFSSRVKKILKLTKKLAGVYIYNAPISTFQFCKKFCRKKGIRLYYDCVEWYSPEEFSRGKFSIAYQIKNRINTKIVDQSFSIIAISRYLEDYYASKGMRVLRVPILCEIDEEGKQKNCHERLNLFYAGSPGRKDLIGNLLKAVLLLSDEERQKMRITLVGVTREPLIRACNIAPEVIDACSDVLELTGRVPRNEVLLKMQDADFTVLPRDASLRYAKAGFPSKVVESLAHSTPILCNFSSDLELYLKDGENALIAADHSPEALAQTIRRAIALTTEEKKLMYTNAIKTAEAYFDYRIYGQALLKLLVEEGEK